MVVVVVVPQSLSGLVGGPALGAKQPLLARTWTALDTTGYPGDELAAVKPWHSMSRSAREPQGPWAAQGFEGHLEARGFLLQRKLTQIYAC